MNAILNLANKIGAPLIRQVLSNRIGARNANLAADVIDAIARRAGVSVPDLDRLAEDNPPVVIDAIRDAEAALPEYIALYAQGLEGQFALLQAEQKGHWLGWAWRPAMMWLLAFLWLWQLVILHVANAIWKIALPPADSATLLGLTSVYMALYMGGHTLKDVVRVRGARDVA